MGDLRMAKAGYRPSFAGNTFDPALDLMRLTTQLERVKALMSDQHWRSLQQIAQLVGGTEASVSARLRDLRKTAFGSFQVERKRQGDPRRGFFVYRVLDPMPLVAVQPDLFQEGV